MRTFLKGIGTQRNQNFVYPPNPPHKRIIVLALLLLSLLNTKVQAQELPKLDSLELSLKHFVNEQWTAERTMFMAKQKGEWLNYVPSVGLTLGLPSVSYSTQSLFAHLDGKKQRKAALESIDRKYALMYNDQLNQLRIEYQKLLLQADKLKLQQRQLETDSKIFAIHRESFDKKEMKPLDYLQRLKHFEDVTGIVELSRQGYQIGILEVMKLAHYGVKNYALYLEEDEECILLARDKK